MSQSPTVAGVVDSVLAALADPTRRQLLDLLSARGQATATTLATALKYKALAVRVPGTRASSCH